MESGGTEEMVNKKRNEKIWQQRYSYKQNLQGNERLSRF